MEWKNEPQYLQFDHLQVKLAVLNHLIYERAVLMLPTDFETCTTAEKRLACLAEYEIPAYMGGYIERLNISEEDEIYFDVTDNAWDGEDARFFVQEISLREARQFPHLRKIHFEGMTDNAKAIAKALKPLDISVTAATPKASAGKTVPLALTLALFVLCSALGGWLLLERVQSLYTPLPEEEPSTVTVIPQPIERHLIHGVLVEHDPNTGKMRLKDTEGHLYCDWLPIVESVNASYFLVSFTEGVYGLFDLKTKSFIALPQYHYASTCLCMKDGELLPESAVLFSTNAKDWYMITTDYKAPTAVDTHRISDFSGGVLVDCSPETPEAYSYMAALTELERKGGE